MVYMFILCWCGFFLCAALLIWRKMVSHEKIYILLGLHFIFLTGFFCLYPLVLNLTGPQ